MLVLALLAAGCTNDTPPMAVPVVAPNAPVSPSPSVPSPTVASPPPTPVLGTPVHKIRGPLHTVGAQIVDEGNHPVRLISIGINGLQKGSGTPATEPQPYSGCFGWRPLEQAAYRQIPSWGFNSIRLQITWANLEPTRPGKRRDGTPVHHWNRPYLAEVDRIVDGFASRGVGVILEMNQVRWSPAFHHIPLPSGGKLCGTGMPTWLYPPDLGIDSLAPVERDFFADKGKVQESFIDAWRFLARRYAKEPMFIGADILNEPYDILVTTYPGGTDVLPADLRLREFYERVGSAIHDVDPDLLLIFEDNHSKRTSRWSVVGRPDLPNEVFSLHWYPETWDAPEGLARLKRYVARAKGWDLPMWIGEFNAFRYTSHFSHQATWASDLRKFLAYAKQNDIGWTITSYGSGQILQPGSDQPKPDILPILSAGF